MNRTICVAVLSLMAIPQTHAQTSQPRYLRGMLVIVGESKESKQPVRNTKVFVRNVGSAITTDTGEFRIQLPTAFRSGRLVTLAIEKPGFVIHYPLSGEFRLPDDELDEIEIRILPEGSKLLWTDQRIERFIEQTAEEASGELRPASVARGDLAKYVLAFGLEYGFTEEEVHTALQEWAEKAKENATDFRQVGLAAFAEGRLDVAAPSLRKAGMDTINDGLKDIEDDSIANGVGEEKVAEGIDDVVLGGDAYFMGNQYKDAIETYYLALKYVDQKTDRARWGRIKFRIGNAASNLGERVDAEKSVKILHQAIESYREASEQTERLANATHWADINHNLGLALTSLANRTGGEEARDLYAEARKVLLEALKINTQERLPTRWANSQIALGNVLQELGKRADGSQVSQLLTEAVEAYENALQVQSRVEHAESWANTQSNLGNALSLKGQLTGGQEGLDLLFEAEHAIQEALSVRTDATQWARAKLNLAIVKAAMGRMISGKYSKRLLLGSLVACQDATRSFTLADYPQQWAKAQSDIGMILKDLADRSEGRVAHELLRDASAALKSALKIQTKDKLPHQWATTSSNLCNVLVRLGQHGFESEEVFDDAFKIYDDILTIWTRKSSPQDWAKTKSNIGIAYTALAIAHPTRSDEAIRSAIAAHEAALEVFRQESFPAFHGEVRKRLERARAFDSREQSQ